MVNGSFAVVPVFALNMDNDCTNYEVVEDSIGQSTGLYDCYGSEIYEGDSLFMRKNSKSYTEDVEWNNELCGFGLNFNLGRGINPKPLGEWLKEYKCNVLGYES